MNEKISWPLLATMCPTRPMQSRIVISGADASAVYLGHPALPGGADLPVQLH